MGNLVLTRKKGESVILRDRLGILNDIIITVQSRTFDAEKGIHAVKLVIEAPQEFHILRAELDAHRRNDGSDPSNSG